MDNQIQIKIGSEIRKYRRRAGMSLADLAKISGIHEVPLGRVERGDGNPTIETLERIAFGLGMEIDGLFTKKSNYSGDSPDVSTLQMVVPNGRRIRPKQKDMAEQLADVILAMEDICGVPKHAEFPLTLPLEASEAGMERLAGTVRELTQIRAGIVLDYFELLESFGLRVLVVSMPKRYGLDGMTLYDAQFHNAFFFIRRAMTPERQIFTLLYELGLLYLFNNQKRIGQRLSEEEVHHLAKKFSAFFLMPESAINRTASQLGNLDGKWTYELLLRIKPRFGVSAQAFLYRLKELALINSTIADEIEEKLFAFYESTTFKEPGIARLPLSENGRLFDLLDMLRIGHGNQDEVRTIESRIKKFGIKEAS